MIDGAAFSEKELIPTEKINGKELIELILCLSRSLTSINAAKKRLGFPSEMSNLSFDIAYMLGEVKEEAVIRMRRAEHANH